MLNHITIMGRMTRDPELRSTTSGTPVATFTLAVDRDYTSRDGGERQTDFIDCVAWRSTGEFVSKYFQKGSMAVVSGRLQIRDWTDKEGNKRRSSEIVVDNIYFGESKRSRDSGDTYFRDEPPRYRDEPSHSNGYDSAPKKSFFAEIDDGDGELPF